MLAGRAPGLHLDDRGRVQAAAVAGQIAVLPLAAVVSSPMERCVETAETIFAAQRAAGRSPQWHIDERLTECDYGEWTGRGYPGSGQGFALANSANAAVRSPFSGRGDSR